MTDLHVFVLLAFTFANLCVTLYNRGLRYPAPKSRREQITRIRAEERRNIYRR